MAHKFPGVKDKYQVIQEGMSFYEKELLYDSWDVFYGNGHYDYEAYVLTDSLKPGDYKFGPLTFIHEPFYVGCGKIGRHIDSAGVGRQKDKYCAKTARLIEIQDNKGFVIPVIINTFMTQRKARMVEKKLMKTIDKNYLTNALFHYTKLKWKKEDYEYMSKHGLLLCI